MPFIIQTEPVDTLEGLEALRPEWDRLLVSCRGATPFQHPEWVIPWWRHLGQGRLLVLALRVAGRLCGLAPLYEKDGEIAFLGSGISDYLGPILDASSELVASEAFFSYLAEREDWSLCRLEELRPQCALLSMRTPHGLRAERLAGEVCLKLNLPPTVAEFKKVHGISGKCSTKRKWRQLFARGLKTRAVETTSDVCGALDAVFTLHEKRWSAAGQKGVLQGREIRAFHEEAAKGFFNKGMLGIFTLILEGREIAALYGFKSRGTFYAYIIGYDPEFAQVSPGKLMLLSSVERCIEDGISEFDLMRGAEKYKYSLGPLESRNSTLVIQNAKKDRRTL